MLLMLPRGILQVSSNVMYNMHVFNCLYHYALLMLMKLTTSYEHCSLFVQPVVVCWPGAGVYSKYEA